jgi:hypothetical protein
MKCLRLQIYGQIRNLGPLFFWDVTPYQSVASNRSFETHWWSHLQVLAEPMPSWKCLSNYLSLMHSLPTVSHYVLEKFLIKSCVRKKLYGARHNKYKNINQPTCQEKLQRTKRTFGKISEYQWHQHPLAWLYYLIIQRIRNCEEGRKTQYLHL